MKNNDDVASSSTDYLERKIKREFRNQSYQVVHESLDYLKETRKIRVHRNSINKIQNLDTEINTYYQSNNSQSNSSSNLDKKIQTNNYKINNINIERNNLLDKRENQLNKNPNLKSSLNYLEERHFNKSAALSNNDFNGSNQSTKTYKTSSQKNYNQNKLRNNPTITISKSNKISFKNKEKSYRINNLKELDLDNDGVPDRIDIDDTRNSVQTVSDLDKVGNGNHKTYKNKQRKYSENKVSKNISIGEKNKKVNFEDRNESNVLFTNDEKLILKKNKKVKFENKKRKKSNINSPLTSNSVGHRTKTQKVILAPSKALAGAGAGLKESLNKEIENSDMEGIKLANSVISPLAKKLKFQTNSLVAKKIGFDRKAYNLNKLEKKIINSDNKVFKVKQAQRKMIRKKAVINAKTVKGSKLDLTARVKALTSQSVTQIKARLFLKFREMIDSLKGANLVLSASGILLIAIMPVLVLAPLFMLAGGSAISSANAESQNQDFNFSAVALSPDVMRWESKVVEELEKYGLAKYKDLVLVLIHLESGGILPDVMQSSESLGLPPNAITDPHKSIEAGVLNLKKAIDLMNTNNVDVQTLIQAYNFGNGFIPYVAERGGIWTQRLSNDFADYQSNKLGWSSYGDKTYVSKALTYLTIGNDEIILDGDFDLAGGKLAYPVPSATTISSPFGWRIHPIDGTKKLHTGTDFAGPNGVPVVAVADGVVTHASNMGGYGQTVMIDHGSGVITLYGHNSAITVTAGQTVKGGQLIAKVGSTGNSTGPHSHFEVRQNGEYTDPMSWINK